MKTEIINPTVSFIIPTFNEEKNIGGVLEAIINQVAGKLAYQLIVIDNSSTDSTTMIAKSKGAIVLVKPKSFTISMLRNIGANYSTGNILVFIDGDVYLQTGWCEKLQQILGTVLTENIVTGSMYSASGDCWISKVWYNPALRAKNSEFLNGGHLILSRTTFMNVNGFNEGLETGEDVDFCRRIREVGGQIINDDSLQVLHEGDPKTLTHFFKRERWHGKGNFQPISQILCSKMSLSVVMLSICLLISATGGIFYSPYLLFLYPCAIALLSTAFTIKRFGFKLAHFFSGIFLSSVLLTARSFSLFDVLKHNVIFNR